jgi:hypothetical protein
MKGPTIDMTGLADRAGRLVRGLRGRASALWDRCRPEVEARGRAALRWVEECWQDHAHRATLLYRWTWRQYYSPKRPVRSVLWASVRLLWATSHELLGWPSEPATEVESPFEPEFTPCTPNLDAPFGGLPAVGDPPPPPGELPPPPKV